MELVSLFCLVNCCLLMICDLPTFAQFRRAQDGHPVFGLLLFGG